LGSSAASSTLTPYSCSSLLPKYRQWPSGSRASPSTSRTSSGATAASSAPSTSCSTNLAFAPNPCFASPRSCAAPIPATSISPRKPPGCSRCRSGYRACMPTISPSSKQGCCSTTPSIAGAATPPTKRTAGLHTKRGREMEGARPARGSPGSVSFPSFTEAFRVWLTVAALSFGGPAGQIAVMHRILVEEKRWISESRFLHALNYCMLLPGPEAQQLATYVGWLMHRTLGGIMAGGLFVVPGIIAIMALSYVYAAYGSVPFVVALFFGLKAAVLAIVLEAVVRVGKRALKNNAMLALAAAAFIGIFFLGIPFPIIILGAAVIGFVAASMGFTGFEAKSGHGSSKEKPAVVDDMLGEGIPEHARPTLARAL